MEKLRRQTMQLELDDDVYLMDSTGEKFAILIPGLTAEAEVRHGRVYVSNLRINDRPFPARGGSVCLFEAEFAARLIAHIQLDWEAHIRRKWADEYPERRLAAQHAAAESQAA
jgi:hypothetical protein